MLKKFDDEVIKIFYKYGHLLHRYALGLLFVWFGLLKPFGYKTTTSLLSHTIFWGDPTVMILILGWWEVTIGLCLMIRPLVRVAFFLLALRLPGILLAFLLKPDVCFYNFPFALTPEGQYLIKDLTIFVATLAIAGTIQKKSTSKVYY